MSKRQSEPGSGPVSKHAKAEIKEEAAEQRQPKHELLSRGVRYPTLMYKEGEPLAGLQQLYDSSTAEDKIVEVVIPAEFMNNSNNRRVKTRQLWGDVIYTGDSDIVAVLLHLGYFAHYLSHPPGQVSEFRALLRQLPPQEQYPSKARFVKSRAWCSTIPGCSYQVECCWLITRSGTMIELSPSLDEVPAPYPTLQSQLNKQMQTRSTGRNTVKVGQEVSVQFNLCNEPWLKYTLSAVADRGTKPSQWTSSLLIDKVLLFETSCVRYQVSRTGESSGGGQVKDLYTLSKCKHALPMGTIRRLGLPLPADQVEVLEESVGWEEFQWGVDALNVRTRELPIKRLHFAPLQQPES